MTILLQQEVRLILTALFLYYLDYLIIGLSRKFH